jgi:hypothetical protein
MAEERNAEELAAQAVEAVRRIVSEAEARAAEILREAEADAHRIRQTAEAESAQIRERAEADARKQIDAARRALDELGGTLAAAVSAVPGPESAPPPDAAREPEARSESPGGPETLITPPPEEPKEPAPEEHEQTAPEEPDQPALEQPTEGSGAPAEDGGDAAERLVAMKLAVEGRDPAAIEAELVERFGPGDRSALMRDVLSRVAR